ncbi:unnamed protein product [Peniophora sp. CBMAI 1063]|nr:unnamed protein product [Peniophora sp. CBMAI 1063]
MMGPSEHLTPNTLSYLRFSRPGAASPPMDSTAHPDPPTSTPLSQNDEPTDAKPELEVPYSDMFTQSTLSGFAELVHLIITSTFSATPPSTPNDEIPAFAFSTTRFGLAELTHSIMYPGITRSNSPRLEDAVPSQKRPFGSIDEYWGGAGMADR